ncbi:unnamed protein product [Cladocopium goreaui]|uniref:Uncharacterized protein n=1 Tax=Cladocopium goreaui TaxID=2562237 RepID=A0A9P1BHP7_9DINO|nr:unnamed protein product [Cladocopium goreaui]
MLPAGRLRLSRFAVGDTVEYWSATSKSWVQAKVNRTAAAHHSAGLGVGEMGYLHTSLHYTCKLTHVLRIFLGKICQASLRPSPFRSCTVWICHDMSTTWVL